MLFKHACCNALEFEDLSFNEAVVKVQITEGRSGFIWRNKIKFIYSENAIFRLKYPNLVKVFAQSPNPVWPPKNRVTRFSIIYIFESTGHSGIHRVTRFSISLPVTLDLLRREVPRTDWAARGRIDAGWNCRETQNGRVSCLKRFSSSYLIIAFDKLLPFNYRIWLSTSSSGNFADSGPCERMTKSWRCQFVFS